MTRHRVAAWGWSIILALSGIAAAQEKKSSAMPPPPPAPAAEMQRLTSLLLGTWDVQETYHPAPGMPQGGTGKGYGVFANGPGSLSLIFEYRSQTPSGPFTGHGIIAWSPEEKRFKEFWVESTAGEGWLFTGTWKGDSLVFTGSQLLSGKKYALRMTLSGFRDNAFHVLYEMGPDGGTLAPLIEYRFKRAPGGAKRKPEPSPGARRD
jgi:hypothetical protein